MLSRLLQLKLRGKFAMKSGNAYDSRLRTLPLGPQCQERHARPGTFQSCLLRLPRGKSEKQSPQSSGPSTAVLGGSLPPPLLSRQSLVVGFGEPSTIFRNVYVYSSPSPPILNLSGVSLDVPCWGLSWSGWARGQWAWLLTRIGMRLGGGVLQSPFVSQTPQILQNMDVSVPLVENDVP